MRGRGRARAGWMGVCGVCDVCLGRTACSVCVGGSICAPRALCVASPPHARLRRQDGATSVWIASQEGYVEVVRVLIDGRADINAADEVDTHVPIFS